MPLISAHRAADISSAGLTTASFNGTAITYDDIGNPLRYYNGSSYTFGWEGRRLVSALTSGKSMSFTYNEEGLRVTKTVNGETTHFIYDGSLLIAEYNNSAIIVYIYDAAGSPIGFKVKSLNTSFDVWNVFWYDKNLQGDVVAVYNSAGTKLVSYTYNAWGIPTTSILDIHNMQEGVLANSSNILYRGYYYDSDLGMYYLQSRYYDANIGRFISSDGAIGQIGNVQGANMFAYCFNNPMNMSDPTGNWPKLSTMLTLQECRVLRIFI